MSIIFGIGLPRTGTSSLHHAAEALGLRSRHHVSDPRTRSQIERGDYRLDRVAELDLLIDSAVPAVFPQIHTAFPDARFIYTVRDEDSWVASLEKVHFTKVVPKVGSYRYYTRLMLYGVTIFNEERYRYVFREHDRRVREYFAGERARSLLVFDVTKGHGWEQLCAFLEREVPGTPFPHSNRNGKVQGLNTGLRRRIERRLQTMMG
jgi:hypothetical protein